MKLKQYGIDRNNIKERQHREKTQCWERQQGEKTQRIKKKKYSHWVMLK